MNETITTLLPPADKKKDKKKRDANDDDNKYVNEKRTTTTTTSTERQCKNVWWMWLMLNVWYFWLSHSEPEENRQGTATAEELSWHFFGSRNLMRPSRANRGCRLRSFRFRWSNWREILFWKTIWFCCDAISSSYRGHALSHQKPESSSRRHGEFVLYCSSDGSCVNSSSSLNLEIHISYRICWSSFIGCDAKTQRMRQIHLTAWVNPQRRW